MFAILSAATGFTGASAATTFSSAPTITVTPWCDNSLRVRVTPSTLPAAAQAAADHLRATLQRNSLADIPSALIDKCGPGTPTPAPPGATVKAGNLQLDVRADGSLAFSAVDSGKAYFAATPASHTAQSPRRSRAAVAGAVSTAAASVSVSAIARTCVAAVTIQQMRPATF